MAQPREKRIVGYCNHCGGPSYDDGVNFFHVCPPPWPEAQAIVAVRHACDEVKKITDRRHWAKMIPRQDIQDLVAAIDNLTLELDRANPQK